MSTLGTSLQAFGAASLAALLVAGCTQGSLRSLAPSPIVEEHAAREDDFRAVEAETQPPEAEPQPPEAETQPPEAETQPPATPRRAAGPEPSGVLPTPPRVDVRGRVISATTREPLGSGTPRVVLVLPGPWMEEAAPAEPPVAARVARLEPEGADMPLVVTSPGVGIRFENRDDLCHGYFSSSPAGAFETGVLQPGESATVELEHPGLVHVYCSLHAGKQMRVLVAPTHHHARVDGEGGFVLRGLTPGEYEVLVWAPGLAARPERVTVGAAEASPLVLLVEPGPGGQAE